MALISPPPKMQFLGDDGLPLSGGLVYTYTKDTTTPLATYTDSTGSVANANPVVLDAYGRANIWFQILPYSLIIHDSEGTLQGCSGPVEFPTATVSGGSDIEAWSDIVVYDYPDLVAGSDGYTYRCIGTNILDDDPVGSVTGAWVNLSSIASPALTGTPTAPTAAEGTNTTQIATTAFVQSAVRGTRNSIDGGNITVSGNTLTITPCTCWDSTRLIYLTTTENKALVLGSDVSATYLIAQVRLAADSSVVFKAYADLAAIAADALQNAFRVIDFWQNTVAGVARAGFTRSGIKWWDRFADNTINSTTAVPADITTAIDISGYLPLTYVDEILLGAQADTNTQIFAVSGKSGTAQSAGYASHLYKSAGNLSEWGTYGYNGSFISIIGDNIYWGDGGFTNQAGTVQLAVHAIKLKR